MERKGLFSFKKFNSYLEENRIASFTQLSRRDKAEETLAELKTLTQAKGIELNFQLAQTANFPSNLLDAKDPIRCCYFLGKLNLLFSKSIFIVGSREASEKGKLRAKQLSKELVREDFTIISGLAEGIDTAAHTAAIDEGSTTIGVIGTACTFIYPTFLPRFYDRFDVSDRSFSKNKTFWKFHNLSPCSLFTVINTRLPKYDAYKSLLEKLKSSHSLSDCKDLL